MHLMVHLDDEAQVEARSVLFGDTILVPVHGLGQTNYSLRNHFERTRWYS
jgi:hypothetical protein